MFNNENKMNSKLEQPIRPKAHRKIYSIRSLPHPAHHQFSNIDVGVIYFNSIINNFANITFPLYFAHKI